MGCVLFAFAAVSYASSAELILEKVAPSEVPDSLRLEFLERYLGIQRYDWKLEVPEGYEAVFIFRQRTDQKILLELKYAGPAVANLFLATAPGRTDPKGIEVVFGDEKNFVTTFMQNREGWTMKFGNPGGISDNHLFEIWNPASEEAALFWCEVQFSKK